MKIPKLKVPRPKWMRGKKKFKASTRSEAARQHLDDLEEIEPKTRLSVAFFMVFLVHIVAVGGVCAYSSIKRNRESLESIRTDAAPPVVPKPTKPVEPQPPGVGTGPTMAGLTTQPPERRPVLTPQESRAPVSGLRTHRVSAGETLTKIANQYAVTVGELEDANQIKRESPLKQDQVLNIPNGRNMAAQNTEPRPRATARPTARPAQRTETISKVTTPDRSTGKVHKVAKSETLEAIGRKYGVTAVEIAKLNNITDPGKLQIGTPLKIPAKK